MLKVTKPITYGDDVKALQAAHGLIVDGQAGRYTIAALGGTWKE